jgi:hypothetical protein
MSNHIIPLFLSQPNSPDFEPSNCFLICGLQMAPKWEENFGVFRHCTMPVPIVLHVSVTQGFRIEQSAQKEQNNTICDPRIAEITKHEDCSFLEYDAM